MIALAFVLGVTLAAAVGSIVWFAHRLASTTDREADARVHEAELAGQLAVALANVQTQAARADNEQRRADAYDDLLDQVAADGDAAGARARVLARYARQAANSASGDRPGHVPTQPSATSQPGMGRDDLILPGD